MSLREAAQQALEALEEYEKSYQAVADGLKPLRAALAEEVMQRLTVDPVAYVNDEGWFRSAEDADAAFRATARPLYAAPPQREPLTDAEIKRLYDSLPSKYTLAMFARAIERAHGIGGEE